MRFPEPWRGFSTCELKKPDTNTILNVAEKAESGKSYAAMLAWIEGSIETVDGERPKDLRFIPLVNAEVVSRDAFMLYKLPTLVEGVYPCPRCGALNKHEEGVDSDNRDDIAALQVTCAEEEPKHELDLSESPIEIYSTVDGKKELVVSIKKLVFRSPTIDDLLKIETDQTLKTSVRRMKKLYMQCMIDFDGEVTGGEDFNSIKNKYSYDLLNFPDFRDFDRLTHLFRRFGFNHMIAITCEQCSKEYEKPVDFTGFFVSALLSASKGRSAK